MTVRVSSSTRHGKTDKRRRHVLIQLAAALLAAFTTLASSAGGGVQVKLELTTGTQDTLVRFGLFGFGTISKGQTAAEAGLGLWGQAHASRYGAATRGWAFGYEAFALVGHGNNDNLLGSTVASTPTNGLFRAGRPSHFFGLGFGVTDERLSGSLAKFGIRRGNAIIRVADGDRSLHLSVANDLRIGPIVGEASDFGPTSSVQVGFARGERRALSRFGLGFDIFTPKQDYGRAPSNPTNSGDGRKRSWYTTAPWGELFHANLYVSAARIEEDHAWSAKLGLDSAKLGAYVQNRIHDGFGLYPRFPWPVGNRDRPYVELTGAGTQQL